MNVDQVLEKEFEDYFNQVYPDAGEGQKLELRRTFYIGIYMAIKLQSEDGFNPHYIRNASLDVLYSFFEMAQRDINQMRNQ